MKLPTGGQHRRGNTPRNNLRASFRQESPARPLPAQVRVFELEPEVTVAADRQVMVIVWRGAPTVEVLQRLDGYTAKVLESYPRFAVIVIIEPINIKTPSSAAREENGRLTQKYEWACAGIATVLEGETVKHSVVRFSLTTIQLLSSTRVSQQVFDSIQAASRWIAEQFPELSGREISHSVDSIRALNPK